MNAPNVIDAGLGGGVAVGVEGGGDSAWGRGVASAAHILRAVKDNSEQKCKRQFGTKM